MTTQTTLPDLDQLDREALKALLRATHERLVSRESEIEHLKLLLAKRVPPNVNVAIASHGNPFVAVAGGTYLAEGEAAVIEPLGDSGFRIVARIRKDEWSELK